MYVFLEYLGFLPKILKHTYLNTTSGRINKLMDGCQNECHYS